MKLVKRRLKVHFYGQIFFNENEYVCCITLILFYYLAVTMLRKPSIQLLYCMKIPP